MNRRQFSVAIFLPIIIVCSLFNGLLSAKPDSRYQSERIRLDKFWETEEIMSDYLEEAEEAYQNYLSIELDQDFETNVIYQSPDYGKSTSENYLIVVYQKLYNPATRAPFMTYIDDLESEGWSVKFVTCTNTGDHVVFRDYLIQEWDVNYIRGSFLIGNLPVAFYEMPMLNDDGDTTGWNFFPCDLYFMDTDGEWIDNERDNGFYDDHTGAVYPDMWVGRLYTPTMTFHDVTETQLVKRYLQKVHDYRKGTLRLKDQALCYVTKDWAGPPDESEVFIIYDEVGFYNEGILGANVTVADYRHRIRASTNNKYEWMYLAAHSSATYHNFKDGDFFSSEIDEIDVQVLFFLNFNCSSALITANDCLCSWYVMQEPYGLLSIGSSKPGSMVCQADYYIGLSSGNTFGDAYLFWGLSYFEMRDWHYGLILIGDPTLKISRFMTKPGPHFCYALSPDRDEVVNDVAPVFRWTVTDSTDYYKLVIENDQLSWTSENIQDTSYQIPTDVLQPKQTYQWSVKAYSGLECTDFSQPRYFTYLDQASSIEQFASRGSLPQELTIIGNYPNPFNSSTTISFVVPKRQPVTMNIYNARGQEIRTLLDHEWLNGKQSIYWNGTDRLSQIVPSGLYFCRISDGDVVRVKKMLFVR